MSSGPYGDVTHGPVLAGPLPDVVQTLLEIDSKDYGDYLRERLR